MTKRDLRYFEIAKNISLSSTYPKIKIGAIVVIKKHIISFGVNSTKSHPIQKIYNKFRFDEMNRYSNHSLHAEVHALVSVPNNVDLSDANIYIYRQNMNGKLAMCRPCCSCMKMIKDYGIKKIYYTTEDGYCEEWIGG